MRIVALASASLACASSLLWFACTSNSNNPSPPRSTSDAGSPGADATVNAGPFALGVPCDDPASSIYGDPGPLPSGHGDILKCTTDPDMSAADLLAVLTTNTVVNPGGQPFGYTGKPFTSGAHVYRILYRTERGDPNDTPGYSSAKVFIPITPRASGPSPILVGAHETWGQAPQCAVFNRADVAGARCRLPGAGISARRSRPPDPHAGPRGVRKLRG